MSEDTITEDTAPEDTAIENGTIDPPSRKPRRWLRFSLRALFVILTLFCLTLGYVVSQARQQRLAVEALHRTGASALYDYQIEQDELTNYHAFKISLVPAFAVETFGKDMFHSVVAVDWPYAYSSEKLTVNETDIELLVSLDHLIMIDFESLAVNSQELATIRQMPRLRYLGLDFPQGKTEWEELKKFTHLKELAFGGLTLEQERLALEVRAALSNTKVSWRTNRPLEFGSGSNPNP